MNLLRRAIRAAFTPLERGLDAIFGPSSNPILQLGALGFFFYWIVAVSGVYLFVFFDTGTSEAYASVEYMTNEQWYLAGVMRSLHRYASDAMVLVMVVHMVREFSLDRYRGARWFTWFTGVPIIWLVFVSGITGYWLVWDRLAQYVALASAEWFDWLPIFGEPIARNFLAPDMLDDRFFTLLIFLHIAIPLILLAVLWIHLQRVARAQMNPPRRLAIATFGMMLVLSLVKPAVSHGPADLTTVAAVVRLDWFYLGMYPLLDYWSNGTVWATAAVLTLMIAALPWMPPMRRAQPAQVDLAHCNGCTWCAEDCPFNAISMEPRRDGRPFERQAVVKSSLCVSCGICAGSCPSATPFRRRVDFATGIDLPDRSLSALRDRLTELKLAGNARIVVFGCDHGVSLAGLDSGSVASIRLPCAGNLPPSFIDYVLSRNIADGVMLTGCVEGECHHRFGIPWTKARIERERDPRLRARVERSRIATCWAGAGGRQRLDAELSKLAVNLADLAPEADEGEARDSAPPKPGERRRVGIA